jgi:hypothetical protein
MGERVGGNEPADAAAGNQKGGGSASIHTRHGPNLNFTKDRTGFATTIKPEMARSKVSSAQRKARRQVPAGYHQGGAKPGGFSPASVVV